MQVNIAGLRRTAKNIAHNYTDPQKKVREATSNDPWGPSSTLMSEIADLTYNIEAFAQIMEMLWKRLNDHGKNWRHVYKSLVLIEYLIKTGSERVAQQCKENIFAIQTLKDFQYLEDNKDQGLNVREKAKQLVVLLSSEEKLRNERTRALKARERFAQTVSGFGSSSADNSNETTPTGANPSVLYNSYHGGASNGSRHIGNPELESARPQTIGEEELQLQIALAMSKEEADQEEKRRRSDDLRLQMALSQSENEFKHTGVDVQASRPPPKKENTSALLDLLDVDLGGGATALSPTNNGDPWAPASAVQQPKMSDPWSSPSPGSASGGAAGWNAPARGAAAADPWSVNSSSQPAPMNSDPWAIPSNPLDDDDEFDVISKTRTTPNSGGLYPQLGADSGKNFKKSSDPLEFLGENKALVNLDNLLPKANPPAASPFGAMNNQVPNPFQNVIQKPSINEMREKQLQEIQQGGGLGLGGASGFSGGAGAGASANGGGAVNNANNLANNPWSPIKNDQNPFFH